MDQKTERIYVAQRAGFLRRMADEGWRPERAAELFRDWEAEADRRGIARTGPGFWRDAAAWYVARRRGDRRVVD